MKRFFRELRRRNVIRTVLVFILTGAVFIAAAMTLLPEAGSPGWLVRLAVVVVVAGLPVAVGLSWRSGGSSGRRPARAGADAAPAAPRHALPPAADGLIGRDEELSDIAELLGGEARIVTITGPDGTGKTRLAVAAGHALAAGFADGVAFVSLEPIRDAGDLLPSVARALGVREVGGRSLERGLEAFVGGRRLLLVLDDVEPAEGASAAIDTLVEACPELRVLATSREPLRLAAERELPLTPLSVPPARGGGSPRALRRWDAVRLFSHRAAETRRRFRVGRGNADAVAGICRHLDGLPLALELAAARLAESSPDAALDGLGTTLKLMRNADRPQPNRSRRLDAAIEWSWSLLAEPEQRLFRRLAVFAGGCTRRSLEAVCYEQDDAAGRANDQLQTLLDAGFVRRTPDGARFVTHPAIRRVAGRKLREGREVGKMYWRHANHFLDFAEEAARALRDGRQTESVRSVEREDDDIREAVEWLVSKAQGGDAEAADKGLRLCGELWFHWHILGMHSRARRWARALLDSPAAAENSVGRIRALRAAGIASWALGDHAYAIEEFQDAHDLALELGSELDAATVSFPLGLSLLTVGDTGGARARLEEAVERNRALDDDWGLGWATGLLAMVEAAEGELARARELCAASLEIRSRTGDVWGLAVTLGTAAAVDAVAGLPERAVQLAAAAEMVAGRQDAVRPYLVASSLAPALDSARDALDPAARQRLDDAGRSMSPDEAVALATADGREVRAAVPA